MPIIKITTAALAAASLVCVSADAASISLNFMENTGNQIFAGGENIGPFSTNSSNWNNPEDASGTGSASNLINDSGVATTADVSWSSANTWYNASGTDDDDHRMAVGYLDDGGAGVNVTFTDIPYAAYEVTLLFGSDQGPGPHYNTLDFTINGGSLLGAASGEAFRDINEAFAETGNNWVELTANQVGNYATTGATGATLTIQGGVRTGDDRGSLVGVIITEVPEPGSLALMGLGGLAVLRRRRG
ncbi:MAG: PEP-CTERM sorting domain-containing protein [Phycisphaerales bacterium JB063]